MNKNTELGLGQNNHKATNESFLWCFKIVAYVFAKLINQSMLW